MVAQMGSEWSKPLIRKRILSPIGDKARVYIQALPRCGSILETNQYRDRAVWVGTQSKKLEPHMIARWSPTSRAAPGLRGSIARVLHVFL